MRKQLFTIVSVACIALFTACSHQPAAEEEVKPSLTVEQLEQPTTLAVKIDGMACPNGCAKPIQDNCAKLTGVAESRVEFASGMGYFTYDGAKLTEQDIIACIEGTNGGDHYKVVTDGAEQEEAPEEAEEKAVTL
jgi:copper chaperone CopZ